METKVDIINALDTLNAEQLNKVAIYVTDIRRAGWAVGPDSVAERPEVDTKGPCINWMSDKLPAGYDGSTGKRPLDETEMKSSTVFEDIVNAIEFTSLIAVADVLGVFHDYTEWLDDEWLGKEDDLRVAVAEVMGKIL